MSDSDSRAKIESQAKLLERVKQSSFPPAAVLGAFASFAGSAFSKTGEKAQRASMDASLVQIGFAEQKAKSSYELEYAPAPAFRLSVSVKPLRRSLSAIAVGPADSVYVLGDGEVRIFDSAGGFLRAFKAPEGSACLAVGPDRRIYIGKTGSVEILGGSGIRSGGFAVGESGKPSIITAIRLSGENILVADVSSRCIRRFTESGTVGVCPARKGRCGGRW